MEQRTLERFRKRVILLHWLHAASFIVLLVSGAIMFFDLTNMSGGQQIRVIHNFAAGFFVIIPVLFLLFDPKAAVSFLKDAFRWDRDDRDWLKESMGFYFGRKTQMPAQGYINGDQKLWQLVVIISGLIFAFTGIVLWFFKIKISWVLYQGILLTHDAAFIAVLATFPVHLYLTIIHPKFEESLSSMVDGRISPSYAQRHYGKWFQKKTGGQ